jgi:hypothetical protein
MESKMNTYLKKKEFLFSKSFNLLRPIAENAKKKVLAFKVHYFC